MLAKKAQMASVSAVNPAWDISYATYSGVSFSVAAQDTAPSGLFFKSDGTKMYVVGFSGDAVYEYDLSSAWDVSSSNYVQNFSVAGQETNPSDLFFKPDGTKMYISGNTGDDINEYSLSSAWDISTATYVQNFSVATQDQAPAGVTFKPDGTKMYVCGVNSDSVFEYSLSTAWNISTASYVQSFSMSAQETGPSGLFFKPDGTKMYMAGSGSDAINEYTLSSAWDISTASFVQNFSVATQETIPQSAFFKSDGLSFWIVGSATDTVYQYDLVEP